MACWLHPEDAVTGGALDFGVVAGGEGDPQDGARVARVDDAVVGDATGGIEGERLLLGPVLDGGGNAGVLFVVEVAPGGQAPTPRRTMDMTPASCFGPMTAILAVGQVNTKRVS